MNEDMKDRIKTEIGKTEMLKILLEISEKLDIIEQKLEQKQKCCCKSFRYGYTNIPILTNINTTNSEFTGYDVYNNMYFHSK